MNAVRRFCLTVTVACAALPKVRPLFAQADSGEPRIRISPTASVGGSIMEFDYSGDEAFRGLVVRGGAALGSILEVTVAGERWPDLGSYDGWALQLESSFYPLGRRRVAPYLLAHLGYFEAELPSGSMFQGERGRTTGVAVGFYIRMWDPLGVRLEAMLRQDAGAGDGQVRALITYTSGIHRLRAPAAEAAAVVYGMARLSGPWHFVEPAYGLKFATGVGERDAAALTIALLHWQVSEPRRLLVPYLWDTRAALLMPAWRHGTRQRAVRWYVQAGPAMTVMLEGPDYGLRGGAHAEVGGSLRVGVLPALTAGVGGVWIVRPTRERMSVPPTDELGLLFHVGLAF